MIEVAHEEYSKDPNGFEKLLIDAEKPLYEGCKKYTKLSTLVKLYNLKVRYGWSDISFSELLKTLKEILPTTNELPNSLYEAKKTLGALGMEYEKIHACPNNCCLYRKEFANATECSECGQSRWKNVKDRNEERKQIPSKVIWYFPPIPRFKRLFRSIECAKNLTWHASEGIEDGKLRHPADSPAWKLVDFKWPDFGSEPRNLRLALSADGVNPHGTLLDIPGKSKDGLNARCDLVDLKLRPDLAPISSEKKIFIPPACYTLTKEEKRCVLKTLSRIKLFPIAIRSVLPKHVRYAITRLCIFFNSVCNKVLDAQQLDKLEEDIVVSTELEVGNSGVSDNLRWIAHGPHPFVDSSLISSGNTQESRIRNLCSRLMVSKPDEVVLAPFNPGGHWALLAINAYEDTVFYLDSLRTTSKATTRYVTDT
ncbi:uncharacterized protein E6C27_scaffold455G00110 [Cucumis melo var. makuwa]|uniref:Ubiquitin-like protease family profile domain-containing protein n=1 Tax=Cucumis melo var. makuwa TaxID=1194695 RepID=A0A5A7V2T4_CUCMM|nr:uncharacterized protein E6C27_scaffold455G00110 [Cucumis melo var. makuwa]